jgi:four helix bundle protein
MDVALASASEVRYLLGLSRRLRYMQPADAEALESRYSELVRGLQKLLTALRTRPEA